MLELKSFLLAFVKSVIITICLGLFLLLILILLKLDNNIANLVCNGLNIPKDLTLTVMSGGFGYDIIFLLLFVESIIIGYIGLLLSKNEFINDLYYKIVYL